MRLEMNFIAFRELMETETEKLLKEYANCINGYNCMVKELEGSFTLKYNNVEDIYKLE